MVQRRSYITMLVAIAVFTIMLAVQVEADQFIKQVTNTDAITVMGQTQPARADTSVVWLSENRSCMQSPERIWVIYDAPKNMLYFVDHNSRTYSEMSADVEKAMDDMMPSDEDDESQEMMKAMAQSMMASMEVTVSPTEETEKIKEWDAKKYIVDMKTPMGGTSTEVWATEDIDLDYGLFQNVANGGMAMMPGFEKLRQEMLKINGVTVKSTTEASMMGATVRSTMEVLQWEQKDAPAGTYDIPDGYKKVDPSEMQPSR